MDGLELKQFPLSPSYCVSPDGKVYRIGNPSPKKPVLNQEGGYLQVSLWESGKGRTWFVHHVVTITFHGPRPSPIHCAAHKDGDNQNNHKDNLRWLTRKENEAEKILHGRTNRGQRNGMSRTSMERRRNGISNNSCI